MHTRIICIDSDTRRAQKPVEVLRASGYEVMAAPTADIGMALIRLFPPDVILLHYALADQLLPQIKRCWPSVKVLLTGDTPMGVEELKACMHADAAGAA